MSTVAQVIAKFRRRYPQCGEGRALELFNDVHGELCTRCPLENETFAVALEAGEAEYPLPSKVVSIREAYYERSSDPADWLVLFERSLDEYALRRKGWRTETSVSEPLEYYVSGGVIGFWPLPSLSSVDGYPRVRLYGTSRSLLGLEDTVPPCLLNDNVYVYGMWAKWEAERQDGNLGDLQAYQILAEREIERNVQHVKNVQAESGTEMVPGFAEMFRGVI